jgi:catechol-2,3-dioxygenase
MHFLNVKLDAEEARTAALRRFYGEELGFPDVRGEDTRLVFEVGTTVIEFTPVGRGRPFYHFALRVPRNRFAAAREWLAKRTELLHDEESGQTTFRFDNWNAEACYAHDPCGKTRRFRRSKGVGAREEPPRRSLHSSAFHRALRRAGKAGVTRPVEAS